MSGPWHIDDLPSDLQDELRDRLAEAKRGDDLMDADAALADADRMTTEILAVINDDKRVAS